jgi:alditol oxidase
MTPEYNWAGNHIFAARRIRRPTSVEELQDIVAKSTRLRAIGTRHSFNGVADTPGDLIDLSRVAPDLVIDREQRTVTVGSASTYVVLARFLESQGWALQNMASLPQISIAGAVATGTHGSGDTSGNLATAVAALEFVTANGDLRKVRRGDASFDGMVINLGALGVVTRVTLDIEPTFNMRQDAFAGLSWASVLSNLDAIMSAAYSVSLMTTWSGDSVHRLWLKARLTETATRPASADRFGAVATAQAIETSDDEVAKAFNPFGTIGPWSERLPHFRLDSAPGPVDQIQSEYLTPRARAAEALARLRAIGDRIDQYLFMSEIRTVAADNLWLSSAYGRDCVAIHFTWKKEIEAVDAITMEIEDLLLPLGARPHWGKVIHARADKLSPLYPRLQDFCDLVYTYDPTGKFRNAFLDAHIFGAV